MRRALKPTVPIPRIVRSIVGAVFGTAFGGLLLGCSTLGPALEEPEVFLLRITPLGRTQEPSHEISGYVYLGDRFRRRLRLDTAGQLSPQ